MQLELKGLRKTGLDASFWLDSGSRDRFEEQFVYRNKTYLGANLFPSPHSRQREAEGERC